MQVLLPSELLTFISLVSVATAFPQASIPANTTAATTSIGRIINSIASGTPWGTDAGVNPCLVTYDPERCSGRDVVELPTATGWYDTEVDSYIVGPPTQTDVVVTSNVPTIIAIETYTAVHDGSVVTSGADDHESEGNNGKPAATTQADGNGSSETPEQLADSPTEANPTAIPSNPKQIAQNSLLLNIISELGGTQPAAQPTHPPSPTTVESGETPGITQGLNTADATNVALVVAPGNSITLGSATITLTPGISTTIGPTSNSTFIAMTTDAAGNTFFTVSSSGIAVTATVSTVSAIVTLPKTGFEASITDVTRPGDHTSSMSRSSSSVVAAGGRYEVEWWMGAVLGMMRVVFEI